MLAKVTSFAVLGLDGAAIQVEVDISRGMPVFIIVGLPDAAVQESKERVRAAIKNLGSSCDLADPVSCRCGQVLISSSCTRGIMM